MIKKIIFDWKRTLYDPDAKTLINGALELLEFLKTKNIHMVLIGKGGEDMQSEVSRLHVGEFFSNIVFVEGEKDPKVFAKYVRDPKSTLFIGDRVRSELAIGNKLGAKTIWVKQGKFANEDPENKDQIPAFTVDNLDDCTKILLRIKLIN